MTPDKLLRPDQAAQRLNVSKRSIYRLAAESQFVCLKIGGALRILESSLNSYIQRRISTYFLQNGVLDEESVPDDDKQ